MQGLNDMKSKYFQSHSNQRSYIYRTFDYSCEESNVFPQFLECIYHIMKQFPNDFEYNARLLCELQIGTYSCAYENFLFTSESERNNYNRAYIDRTGSPLPSIWDYINKNKSIFTNAKYVAPSPLSSNSNDTVGDTPPLYPDTTDIKHWQNDYMGCRKLMDLFKKI